MGNAYGSRSDSLSKGRELTWGSAVSTTALIPTAGVPDFNLENQTTQSAVSTGSRAGGAPIWVGQLGTGSYSFEMNKDSIGHALKDHLGTEVVTGAGPYTHTFTMANAANLPSSTFKIVRGQRKAVAAVGATNNKFSLSVAPDAIVTGTAEYSYKAELDLNLALVAANVAPATGTFTVTNTLSANDPVVFYATNGSTLPDFITEGVIYYASAPVGASFKVAASSGGAALTGASAGTGSFEVCPLEKLTAPTDRVVTFADGSVTIDSTAFGELINFSVEDTNGLATNDKRFGGAGALAGITAGEYTCGGKFEVVWNAQSDFLLAKLKASQSINLVVEIRDDATNKLTLTFGKAYLSGGKVSTDNNRKTVAYDFKAIANPVSPLTAVLVNSHAGAY